MGTRWRYATFLLPACAALALGGCGRGDGDSAEDEQAAKAAVPHEPAGIDVRGVPPAEPELWAGAWESEAFPGLTLEVDGLDVVGTYAGGQGHLSGKLSGRDIEFEFHEGAEEFHGAPLDQRGLGGGTMDPSGEIVKGRYTADAGPDAGERWSMVRPGTDIKPGADEAGE